MPRDHTDGPVAQFDLIHAVVMSGQFTALDHRVAATIIKRYYPRYGNARASLRYLEQATGSTRTNIIASRRRLVEGGVFTVLREGKGTRPTEFAINFHFSHSGIAGDTAMASIASGIACNTSCGIGDDTSSSASGTACDTESYLHKPAYYAGVHESRNVSSDPLSGGQAPADAGAGEEKARDPFEQLFTAYGVRQKKVDARAAYEKLAPDAEMHQRMIAAARAWREAAGDAVGRFHLRRWIEDECYDCDPPTPFAPRERKAKEEAPARAPRQPTSWAGDVAYTAPRGSFVVGIVESELKQSALETTLSLVLETEKPVQSPLGPTTRIEHTVYLEAADGEMQYRGQKLFSQIIAAQGKTDVPEDCEDLHFWPMKVTIDQQGMISYSAPPQTVSKAA